MIRLQEPLGVTALAFLTWVQRTVLFPEPPGAGEAESLITALARLIVHPATIAELLIPVDGRTTEDFFESLVFIGNFVVAANLILVLLWHGILRLRYRMTRWEASAAPLRVWKTMFLIAIGISMSPALFVPVATGVWLLVLFGALACVTLFFFGTCLFSPVSHKYIVPLSVVLRRW